MLAVLKPGRRSEAERIFKKWELDFAVIGVTTDTHPPDRQAQGRGRWPTCRSGSLSDAAPVYERPFVKRTPKPPERRSVDASRPMHGDSLLKMLGAPDMCSKRWIWEQYDHLDAGRHRAARPAATRPWCACTAPTRAWRSPPTSRRAIARPIPYEGAKQAVAEAWRNITAVGARRSPSPTTSISAIPRSPRSWARSSAGIDGIGEACRALDFPIVSGNVLALQRDPGRRHFADPHHRRRRRCSKDVRRMATGSPSSAKATRSS